MFCRERSHRGMLDGLCAAALAVGSLVLACGCGQTPSTPTATPVGDEQPQAAASALQGGEYWEVFQIGEARVGYGHTVIQTEDQDGQEVVRIDGMNRLKFRRAGQKIALGVDIISRQTPQGDLIDFQTSISQGPRPIQQTAGKVVGDQLEMKVRTLGKGVTSTINWKPDFRGPLASQLTLMEKPFQPGETRTVHELMPAANVVCRTEMVAADYEPVDVLGQTKELLRIDITTAFPDGQVQRSTAWADRSGEVLRTHLDAMNVESFRTTKEVALAATDRAEFDMVMGLSVGVDRALEHPHETRQVRYRLTLDDGNPADVFPPALTQEVKPIDEHTAEVTVYAVRPAEAAGEGAEKTAAVPPQEPGPHDLESNSLIQSDDPAIVAAAREIADGQKTTWQIAKALEQYVHEKIKLSNYTQAFDSAAEVMQTGEGDCTEHAVLLAALARAAKIPARVVIGLVYTEQTGSPAFGYHMWDELYIDGRWIPMDATLGRGGIGAAHLKLSQASLQGASALSSFLPVAQVAGKLRIEIEEVE